MITQLRIRNFKALRDVVVSLEPFTVFIGPNDTGKSSALEALYAVTASSRLPIRECFWSDWDRYELVFGQQAGQTVGLGVSVGCRDEAQPGGTVVQTLSTYDLELNFKPGHHCSIARELFANHLGTKNHQSPETGTQLTAVCRVLRDEDVSSPTREFAAAMTKPLSPAYLARWSFEQMIRVGRMEEGPRELPFDVTGFGFATRLAFLKLSDDKRYWAIRDAFLRLFPVFRDIQLEPAKGPKLRRNERGQLVSVQPDADCFRLNLVREDKNPIAIRADSAAAGAVFVLAFLTLVNLPESRRLILIEEPENGLHPNLMGEVVRCLRQAVEREPNSQIVLTTHSPLLIDHVEPREVRVFLRSEADDIDVHSLADVPDIEQRLKHVMLGELVYNEGEERLVKEIREHARIGPG
jgi:energy-coupling factor transporter ATP-binding protein EcfA2